MKKTVKMMGVITAMGLLAVCCACAPYVETYEYTAVPEKTWYQSTLFHTRFKPVKYDFAYYTGFQLDVYNTSETPIAIDWNKTRYLLDGKNMGAFLFPGVNPGIVAKRDVPPSEIAPGKSHSVYIFPEDRGEKARGERYRNAMLPPGEHTLFLVIQSRDGLIKKSLSVTVVETKVWPGE